MLSDDKYQNRDHAVLSASGSKKWLACTMSAAVEETLEEADSQFAREGSYAHDVGEAYLRAFLSGNDGPDVEHAQAICDPSVTPLALEFWNREFDDYVREYVDYTIARIEEHRGQHGAGNVMVLLEQRLDFSRWVPNGFGRGDVVIVYPGGVEVIDLKFGAGVYVDGENNSQTRLYGLGAYERYHSLYTFDHVTVTIHQPRKSNVHGETMSVDDLLGLMHWADELIKPRAAIAWAAVQGDYSQARFSPGAHCSEAFCKARYRCAARARFMLEAAEVPFALAEPTTLTVDQLELVTDRARLAVKWMADCERHLLEEAAAGRATLKRYKMAEGRSFREITDPVQAGAILELEGFQPDDIYAPMQLVALGKLEKLVGKKKLPILLEDYLRKPAGKPTLVPLESERKAVGPSKRPAVAAADEFDKFKD